MFFADFLTDFLLEYFFLAEDLRLLVLLPLFLLLFDDEVLLFVLLAVLLLVTILLSLLDLAKTGMVEQRNTTLTRAMNIYTNCRRFIFFSYGKILFTLQPPDRRATA